MPEGEEEEEEIENLLGKVIKENFLNLVKENKHTSPGSTESERSWTQKGPHQDTS